MTFSSSKPAVSFIVCCFHFILLLRFIEKRFLQDVKSNSYIKHENVLNRISEMPYFPSCPLGDKTKEVRKEEPLAF